MLGGALFTTTVGAQALVECLTNWDTCTANAQDQDPSLVVLAPKVEGKQYSKIDFHSLDSSTIVNRWRALEGNLGIHCYFSPPGQSQEDEVWMEATCLFVAEFPRPHHFPTLICVVGSWK